MKKFSEILTESVRTYTHNVKLSFKPDANMMDKIEQILQKYTVVNISAPRSLPISRVDKDFPGINNPETYVFSVETAYPSSTDMIRHTIALLGMALEQVVVSSVSHDESIASEESGIAANTGDEALLNRDYPAQDNAAISKATFGNEHTEDFIANAIGSTDQMIPKDLKKKLPDRTGKTLNDPEFSIGVKSAMGSTKNKKPVIKSFAR